MNYLYRADVGKILGVECHDVISLTNKTKMELRELPQEAVEGMARWGYSIDNVVELKSRLIAECARDIGVSVLKIHHYDREKKLFDEMEETYVRLKHHLKESVAKQAYDYAVNFKGVRQSLLIDMAFSYIFQNGFDDIIQDRKS